MVMDWTEWRNGGDSGEVPYAIMIDIILMKHKTHTRYVDRCDLL
jgi:hypothetical protein